MCTTPFPRLSCVWDKKCGHVLIKEKINVILSENCLTLAESLPSLVVLGGTSRWSHRKTNLDLGTESTPFWVRGGEILGAELLPFACPQSGVTPVYQRKIWKEEKKVQEKKAAGLFPEEPSRLSRVSCPQLTSHGSELLHGRILLPSPLLCYFIHSWALLI